MVFVILFSPPNVLAHGDSHEQIAAVTKEISEHPNQPELLLKRAELHRLHGEFGLALADCQQAEKAGPKLTITQFYRGRILFDAGFYMEARAALDRFLAIEKKHAEGWLTRARASMKLENFGAAAADFSKAIEFASVPEPDFYMERAGAWLAAGNLETALVGIDEGISRLGAVASLEIPAIELDVKLQRYDSALRRVDVLAAQSQRKETWHLKRGEVLEKAGRLSEATEAYAKTAEALAQLPPRYKLSEPTKRLENQLAAARQRLQTH